jgi:hypothetical protein
MTPQPEVKEEKAKPGELCIMACNFCKDPEYLKCFGLENEADAKNDILIVCGINSRKELDINPDAAKKFHEMFRIPFLNWKKSEPVQRAA